MVHERRPNRLDGSPCRPRIEQVQFHPRRATAGRRRRERLAGPPPGDDGAAGRLDEIEQVAASEPGGPGDEDGSSGRHQLQVPNGAKQPSMPNAECRL
jgi:hypothetical protein